MIEWFGESSEYLERKHRQLLEDAEKAEENGQPDFAAYFRRLAKFVSDELWRRERASPS